MARELEHGDIELAKASGVSNDFDPRDLVILETEYHCLGPFAAGSEDQSGRSVDECRLDKSHTSREGDELVGPCCSALQFAGLASFLWRRIDSRGRFDVNYG